MLRVGGGKLNANGKPGVSSHSDNVASSKPVNPTCERRTKTNSCGPVWVISVAVFPNLGPISESQRFDGVFVDGGRRELRMLAS